MKPYGFIPCMVAGPCCGLLTCPYECRFMIQFFLYVIDEISEYFSISQHIYGNFNRRLFVTTIESMVVSRLAMQCCHEHVIPPTESKVISNNRKSSRRAFILGTVGGSQLVHHSLEPGQVLAKQDPGDWSTPGLASGESTGSSNFIRKDPNVIVQEILPGSDEKVLKRGNKALVDFVLRRANGYFIYSTVEGVSFQPSDIPTGAVVWNMEDDRLLPGLIIGMEGMRQGGRRRILIAPSMGYESLQNAEPRMPTFGTRRQLDNHKKEPLVFEVQLIRIL